MKKAVLIVFFTVTVINCFAQGPHISLGRIPNATSVNGAQPISKTTRLEIIKNSKLLTNVSGFEVESFSFMIKVGTDIIHGPIKVKGPNLTPEIIKIIEETKGHGVTIFFDDIAVRDGGVLRYCPSISFTYDE